MTDLTIAGLLAEHAALLEGTEAVADGESTHWRLDGVAFAIAASGAGEFRLRREVAAAALRTPDVTPSPRGAGWVRFAPAVVDGFAADRARAWLESAWRHADDGAAGED